jgi:Cache domain
MRNSDEGVISYLFPTPGTTQPMLKIGYVMRFEPWNAVFVTCETQQTRPNAVRKAAFASRAKPLRPAALHKTMGSH